MSTFTLNYRLEIPAFDATGWDVPMKATLNSIDSILAQFNAGINLQGLWLNSTPYAAGMSVIDGLTGQIWACGITHTSSASPTTFATDRTNNPTFWTNITNPAATAAQSATASAGSAAAALVSQTAAGVSASAASASAIAAAASATGATNTSNALLAAYSMPLNRPTTINTSVTVLQTNPGARVDSTKTVVITLGGGGMAKSTAGTWVAGNANNGMGTGLTIGNNTWYYVFLATIAGATDVFFDTSITAANKPASTTAFVRIGSFRTNGSAQIISFIQNENEFILNTPVNCFNAVFGVTTAITESLSAAVPPIAGVKAKMSGLVFDSVASSVIYLSGLNQADVAPTVALAATAINGPVNSYGSFSGVQIVVDGTSQIRARVSTATATALGTVLSYIDPFV